jgi:ribosomal protein S27AE
MADKATDDRRTCRTCGESYEYPGHNSLATRTTCERCLEIDEPTRRVLGILRRRIDQLARQVDKLHGG